ncbi:MAG: laccase domain-containing protein [Erysipelotrichaceae bacterium]|nr:laccase domain-containing protein [Erysipelotrichaceae bacterium]
MKDLIKKLPLSNNCVALTTTTALGNLAYHVEGGANVRERREALSRILEIAYERFVFVHQSHSDRIYKVEEKDLGKGTVSFESGPDCDALYTYLKEVPLCIFHADCVPVFFIDEAKGLVGIIHAGFEGTLKRVVYKSIKHVIEQEKINPSSLKFFIGPYRRVDSFKAKESTKQQVIEAGYAHALINNHFDNGLAVKGDLFDLGIEQSQIFDCELDTVTNEEFYSAHLTRINLNKTPTGRLVSLIYLK